MPFEPAYRKLPPLKFAKFLMAPCDVNFSAIMSSHLGTEIYFGDFGFGEVMNLDERYGRLISVK